MTTAYILGSFFIKHYGIWTFELKYMYDAVKSSVW